MASLNKQGKTIVVVMHHLNQACRYADRLVIMKAGSVITQGLPEDIFTEGMLLDVFDFDAIVIEDPQSMTPMAIAKQRKTKRSSQAA